MNRKSKKGFTLVEVVVVVVIICLLAFIAVPAFNKVRQANKDKVIVNNLKVIATAGAEYLQENDITQVNYTSLTPNYLNSITPVSGENYDDIIIKNSGGTLSVIKSDGKVVSFDY